MDIWVGIVIGILVGVVAALGYEIKTLADWITSQSEKPVSEYGESVSGPEECVIEPEETNDEKYNIADEMLVMQERMRMMSYDLNDIKDSIKEYNKEGLERLKSIEEGVSDYGQEVMEKMNRIEVLLDGLLEEEEDEEEEEEDLNGYSVTDAYDRISRDFDKLNRMVTNAFRESEKEEDE